MVPEIPGTADRETFGRVRTLGTDVGEHEAAGAVGDLDHPRSEAGLAEERSLLVAEDGCDRHPVERGSGGTVEPAERGGAEAARRRADLGERVRRDAEELAQLGRPGELGGVEEQGAAGVGGVGGVDAGVGPAGEVPQEPRVHGAERKVRVVRAEGELTGTQEPGGLGGAEIRIEYEAGQLAHERQVTGPAQLLAHRRGAAVLPHDGPVQGPAARPVEGDERLPLVGDADSRDGFARVGEAAAELVQSESDRVPDLRGVVLDPAGAGEVLRELPVGDVGDPAPLVHGEGSHACGAGVDGDRGGHGRPTLTGRVAGYRCCRRGVRPFPAQTIANGL